MTRPLEQAVEHDDLTKCVLSAILLFYSLFVDSKLR